MAHASADVTSDTPDKMPAEQPGGKPPRYWPAVALVSGFWAYDFLCRPLELSMLYLFLSRMVVTGILLLAFPIWWLTSRQLRRGDRWFAVGIVILAVSIAVPLSASPGSVLGIALMGLPMSFTAATLWLLVARWTSKAIWRTGLAAAVCLPLGFLTMMRWEGLTGDQRNELHWRWEPTAEEQFLAERPTTKAADQSLDEPLALQPGDWPGFRGADRDGVVTGAKIATDWNNRPPKAVWRQRVGPAWSSVSVVAGRLFTEEQRGEKEAVVCYDIRDGREIWTHEDSARFPEGVAGIGPRATPTFADGRLYSSGALGMINCLDAATGEVLWSHDLVAESGGAAPPPQSGFWGFACSPLVIDGVAIVYGGGTGKEKLWAFDAQSGKLAWSTDAGANNYSSPQPATINARRQVLFFGDRGLMALEPSSGDRLWEGPESAKAINAMVQPHLISADQLLLAADGGLMRFQVKPAGDTVELTAVWPKPATGLRPTYNDFVVHDGFIYGFDEGIFGCLDLATGKRTWKRGRYGHGQVLLLPDRDLLLVTAESGEVVLLTADPKQLRELGRFQALDGKTWNTAVVAHGRLYVRNAEEMACYDFSDE